MPPDEAKTNNVKPTSFNISNRRYIGGKSLLLKTILESIPAHINRGSFCDIFAGTGVVGAAAFSEFESVVFNDFLFSNEVNYQGFFGKGTFSQTKLEQFRMDMTIRASQPIRGNYFSKNFSGKYFSETSAKVIGMVRETIEENPYQFNQRERAIALSSLIYSADRIANTVGHYDAYRKGVDNFKNFEFRLIAPTRRLKADIHRKDANQLAREISPDVVYIDPPYNSRQYSRFYHVLENLTKWEKPALDGVALKPPIENMSDYCKIGAVDAFVDLISNLDTKLIIVSYNNTYNSKSSSSRNKISLEEISSILRTRGKTRTQKISHKHFSAGSTTFENHMEYLFLTEVN